MTGALHYLPSGYQRTSTTQVHLDSHNNIPITNPPTPTQSDSEQENGQVQHFFVRLFGERFGKDYFENVKEDMYTPHNYVVSGSAQNLQLREDKFTDPYKPDYKVQLMNCYAFDYIVRTAINKRMDFVLGRATSTVLYPVGIRTYKSVEAAQQALNAVYPPAEQRKLLDYIDRVDWITDIKKIRRILATQAIVGGRSAALIEKINKEDNPLGLPEGTPAVFKPLNWGLLGNVKINTNTWGLRKVYYDDNIFARTEDKWMDAKDLLYWTRSDFHVLPNQFLYGVSDLQPIVALSRTTRYINEMDLPEINASQWSSSGFWEVTNFSFNDTKAFLQAVQQGGRHHAFTAKVKFNEIKLTNDLRGLLEERDKNHLAILIQLQTPSFLISGYEQITNRATANDIIAVWDESVLEGERDWIRDMLAPYYESLIAIFTEEDNIYKQKAKIVIEFQKLRFESLDQKADAIVKLIEAGVIDPQEAREMLGFGPLKKSIIAEQELESSEIDEIKAREDEAERKTSEIRNKNVVNEITEQDKAKSRSIINSAKI